MVGYGKKVGFADGVLALLGLLLLGSPSPTWSQEPGVVDLAVIRAKAEKNIQFQLQGSTGLSLPVPLTEPGFYFVDGYSGASVKSNSKQKVRGPVKDEAALYFIVKAPMHYTPGRGYCLAERFLLSGVSQTVIVRPVGNKKSKQLQGLEVWEAGFLSAFPKNQDHPNRIEGIVDIIKRDFPFLHIHYDDGLLMANGGTLRSRMQLAEAIDQSQLFQPTEFYHPVQYKEGFKLSRPVYLGTGAIAASINLNKQRTLTKDLYQKPDGYLSNCHTSFAATPPKSGI